MPDPIDPLRAALSFTDAEHKAECLAEAQRFLAERITKEPDNIACVMVLVTVVEDGQPKIKSCCVGHEGALYGSGLAIAPALLTGTFFSK